MPHLDDLDLEMLRTGEGTLAAAEHVIECAECREQMAFLDEMSRALRPEPTAIPPEVDHEIGLWIASRAQSIRRGRVFRWAAVPLAAAVVVLGVLTNLPGAPHASDVNGDGRLDILDAFAVARAVEKGDPLVEWDQNGDGVVDRADVDLLAFAAVSTTSGEPL
jgi:predicted anti-sigma-YlaC factor YlaD